MIQCTRHNNMIRSDCIRSKAFSTSVEIKAYASMLLVALRARLLTKECPYPCKPMRKVYRRISSARSNRLPVGRLARSRTTHSHCYRHEITVTDSTYNPDSSLTTYSQAKMAAAFWTSPSPGDALNAGFHRRATKAAGIRFQR